MMVVSFAFPAYDSEKWSALKKHMTLNNDWPVVHGNIDNATHEFVFEIIRSIVPSFWFEVRSPLPMVSKLPMRMGFDSASLGHAGYRDLFITWSHVVEACARDDFQTHFSSIRYDEEAEWDSLEEILSALSDKAIIHVVKKLPYHAVEYSVDGITSPFSNVATLLAECFSRSEEVQKVCNHALVKKALVNTQCPFFDLISFQED